MEAQYKIWCDEDEHSFYQHYIDFNEWLNGEDGQALRDEYGIDDLSQPSKALYAGDKEAYDQAFREYRKERRHEALNEVYLKEQFGDSHWFDRNCDRFEQLVKRMEGGNVVPFIGAGISVSGGFPSWKAHLREQGRTAHISAEHIEALLADGQYEKVIEEIEQSRGREVFTQEIRDVFSRTGSIPDVILRLYELFTDTLITTNYDRLIEQAFETGADNPYQIINGMHAMQKPDENTVTIVKLHGDIKNPAQCILSKNQYDQAYGRNELDMTRPIPKLLSYYYKNSSLLFLGCSLNNDRTLHVFQTVKSQLGDREIPQHFSIEQAPENEQELAERNAYLAKLGITAIWFEKERFDSIESMLKLAKNELRYRGIVPKFKKDKLDESATEQNLKLNLDLSHFLKDFVDLMPLMYWLHRRVPKSETGKYLHAMQQVFYAHSIFTEQTNEHLLQGLDHVLRAISNNLPFDGYSHGKLSIAFEHFQHYLAEADERNYLDKKFDWNLKELLRIPKSQLEELITSRKSKGNLDYHAIRLIVALLKQGLSQLNSPDGFCELSDSVNTEFAEYLSLGMLSKFGLITPDRLDDIYTSDINLLCKDAWERFDRPMEISFLNRVRLSLLGISRVSFT